MTRVKFISSDGYVMVKDKSHPMGSAGGEVLEQRLVWFDHYGHIPEGHIVHHKNKDRADNRLENLECLSRADHMRHHNNLHNPIRRSSDIVTKVCSRCRRQKKVSLFYKDIGKADGFRYWCKECCVPEDKKRYFRNRRAGG